MNNNPAPALPDNYDPDAPAVFDPELDGERQEANIDANRVLADQIAALMEIVHVFSTTHEGTTTSIASVYLPNGYLLATETSTCNDPSLFDPQVGKAIAEKRARLKAQNKLWELEGYRLMTMFNLPGGTVPRSMDE